VEKTSSCCGGGGGGGGGGENDGKGTDENVPELTFEGQYPFRWPWRGNLRADRGAGKIL